MNFKQAFFTFLFSVALLASSLAHADTFSGANFPSPPLNCSSEILGLCADANHPQLVLNCLIEKRDSLGRSCRNEMDQMKAKVSAASELAHNP